MRSFGYAPFKLNTEVFKMKVKITKNGDIRIPKKLREEKGLTANTEFEIKFKEGDIILVPCKKDTEGFTPLY